MTARSRLQNLGIGLAAALILAAAYFKWQSLHSARTAQELQQKAAAIEAHRAALRASLARQQPTPTKVPAGAARKKRKSGDAGRGFLAEVHSDPVLQNLYLAYQKSGLRMRYAALFAKLQLSDVQIEKFEANLMAKKEKEMDTKGALVAQHLSEMDPAAQAIMSQTELEYVQVQTELLGQNGFEALQQFDREFNPRDIVANFSGSMLVEGDPLTAEQTQQLSAIVIGGFHPPTNSHDTEGDWATIDREAAAILNPQQFQLFQQGEIIGPFGAGSRYQLQLNDLITKGDEEDHAVAKSSP